jgi:hypothetical protein
MQFEAIRLVRDRSSVVPDYVPSDAVIFNAPRPLFGEEWQGDFCCGIFYAAIGPSDYNRINFIEENRKLQAAVLIFISEEEARWKVREYLIAEGYTDVEDDVFEEYWRDCFHENFSRAEIDIF